MIETGIAPVARFEGHIAGAAVGKRLRQPYLRRMLGAFDFCLPTKAITVPSGDDWLHEVKYVGYRLRLERDGNRVLTRGCYNWTDRYPWIVEAALKNRHKQLVVDGEAVVLGVDGVADFNALHSRKHNYEVQLYAFDVLALDGDDVRALPLSTRKTNLARLLARRPDGIFIAEFEHGEIGPDLFRAACRMGLEGWCRSGGIGLMKPGVQALGQGEEPAAPGTEPGDRLGIVHKL